MRTDFNQWHKSAKKDVCGVLGGLAEWQGWKKDKVQIVFFLSAIFTSGFTLAAYVILAVILPEADEVERQGKYDAYKENQELKDKYSKLKAKVEKMEAELFNKEKEWDEKFKK